MWQRPRGSREGISDGVKKVRCGEEEDGKEKRLREGWGKRIREEY